MPTSHDKIVQHFIAETVRDLGRLIAQVATLENTRTGIPNVSEILMSEIVEELSRLNIPSKIAADMLGISRQSYYRKKKKVSEFTNTALNEIIDVLENKELTHIDLLNHLSHLEPEKITSAIHHLSSIDAIEEHNGKLKLLEHNLLNDLVLGFGFLIISLQNKKEKLKVLPKNSLKKFMPSIQTWKIAVANP